MNAKNRIYDLIQEAMNVEELEEIQARLVPVTARIASAAYDRLHLMASDFGKSRSSLAAELLEAAVHDAYETYWQMANEQTRDSLNERVHQLMTKAATEGK